MGKYAVSYRAEAKKFRGGNVWVDEEKIFPNRPAAERFAERLAKKDEVESVTLEDITYPDYTKILKIYKAKPMQTKQND